MLTDVDAYMRSFDTTDSGKQPEASMVGGIDVLVFDIQDVGARVYTYISTMAYCMQACAERLSSIMCSRNRARLKIFRVKINSCAGG